MELVPDDKLERSSVVANSTMNRERCLRGSNGYDHELKFDPLEWLGRMAEAHGSARWLDLCCGSGKALGEAASLVEQNELPIAIVGVDLVDMFAVESSSTLSLVQASVTEWQPDDAFDLITCIHGLHYVGDKLRMIVKAATWLTEWGRWTANLDLQNVKVEQQKTSRSVGSWLREVGFSVSTRNRLIECEGRREAELPFEYLGANDQAGPNYTGQPVVDSHYRHLPL